MSKLYNFEEYMLTTDNLNRWMPVVNISKNIEKVKNNTKKIIPNNKDSFFWLIYKIINGEHMYEINNNFQTEKNTKIKYIEQLRLIKSKLKTYKLKLNDIENELLNEKFISIKGFLGLCILFEINVFYIWNNKYLDFICCDKENKYIIKNNNNNIELLDEDTKYYENNYFYVDNIDKPIKSITSYSKDDLIKISKKLNISNPEKVTKKYLYSKILELIS